MKAKEWKEIIIKSCEDAGTYKPYFECVIDTLAQILEDRDITRQQYIDNGAQPVIEKYAERTGLVNLAKNPLLLMINDLNAQALAYWKELGLTASSLKKINESAIKVEVKKETVLEKALRELSA